MSGTGQMDKIMLLKNDALSNTAALTLKLAGHSAKAATVRNNGRRSSLPRNLRALRSTLQSVTMSA